MHGILVLNKPIGWSSRDAVDVAKKLARPAKVGHAGTLDPLATGILIVGIGSTTRLLRYAQDMMKTYQAEFRLGVRSASLDLESTLEDVFCPLLTADDIRREVPSFTGTIQQTPPAYSAIKVGGQCAYALARRGKAVELTPRAVTVHAIQVLDYSAPLLRLRIECDAGTYIRSLGHDLALRLGTDAVMAKLERCQVGPCGLDVAVSPESLDPSVMRQALRPALELLPSHPRRWTTAEEVRELWSGRPIPLGESAAQFVDGYSEWAAIAPHGELVSVLVLRRDGQLWPAINLVDSAG